MRMERVVITGMGTVNALAKNTAAFARALQEGACGIGLMTCVKPREMNKPAWQYIKHDVSNTCGVEVCLYNIVFYTTERGDSPLDDFLDGLDKKSRAKVAV